MEACVERKDLKEAKEQKRTAALALERNRWSSPSSFRSLLCFASFVKTRYASRKTPHIVHVDMSFDDALRICPQAPAVTGKYQRYADFAELVRRLLQAYTPAVETFGLRGYFMDFTGTERLYPDFEAALRRVQAEIVARTGLSASIGAGRTRVIAAAASRLKSPQGLRIVWPEAEGAFLAPLPVATLHGVPRTHADTLARRGVITIGQLRLIPKPVLIAAFGKAGEQIWRSVRGLDELEAKSLVKSGGWHPYLGREKPHALQLERTFP